MKVRHRIARHLGLCVAGFWFLTAGIAMLSGCVKVDDESTTASLALQPAATSVAPGGSLVIEALATNKDGAPVKDNTQVSFKVDTLGAISPAVARTNAGKAMATFTAGAAEGIATITVKSGDASDAASVQIVKGTPAPAPTPGGGAGIDQLDPNLVSWDEPAGNVGAWKITSKIVSASMTHERYSIVRDPMNNWPAYQEEGWSKPSIGNWWVIGKCSDGRWHAATVDWLGVGKTSMEAPYFNGNDDIHGLLATWRPRSGEVAYAMQSTHARSGVLHNNRQRTNIYKIIMP
jgi:hypothetical protein